MRTVVLVEGVTDELALRLAAAQSGRDLVAEQVSVVPINGAHAISRFLRRLAADEPGATPPTNAPLDSATPNSLAISGVTL